MRKLFFGLTCACISTASISQQVTIADYDRAAGFLWQNLNNKKVYNLAIEPSWFADSSGFSYVTQSKAGKIFYQFVFNKKQPEPFFDQARLAKSLGEILKREIKASDLPVFAVRKTGKDQLQFGSGDNTYLLDLNTYAISLKPREINDPLESKSPDGEWVAFSKDHNLFIRSTKNGTVKQLSTAGFKNYEYASYYGWGDITYGEGVNRPSRFDVYWSPDSKWIQTFICDLRSANKMYLLDWSIDTAYRAKLLSYFRASPGDTNMVHMIPVFFNVETGEEIRKDDMRGTHTNPAFYEWSKKEPGIIYENKPARGYQQSEIFSYDVNKKIQESLYAETSSTNIDGYSNWLHEEWGKLIIASERDGWRQLYSLDLKNKSLQPITRGSFHVNEIPYWDDKKRFIIFTANGREEGRNPYLNHVYRINLDGTGMTLLTPENANHDIYVSPDGNYMIDNYSTIGQPTRTVLRETTSGKIIAEISKAMIDDLLAMHYPFAEQFTATARDGITTIYGALWKPSDFDPKKKYPVIDASYTGPHTNTFPRNFGTTLTRNNQPLAELGFIVVSVDGMGTAGRSKAFHNVSYKNMGKNLLDHVLAIRQLGQKYSWIDTSRVGIFGHSAGGYDAGHALLDFPDFYKVGVASSADHDFRMEKDWWPEMYMGWPVDSTYNEVSNITMAGNLKGKLLITHGGIDKNVNPSATFKLAEALVKANKEFDMLIFPSQHHGYTGNVSDYFMKKKWNYFVEHLLGAKPIWDFKLTK